MLICNRGWQSRETAASVQAVGGCVCDRAARVWEFISSLQTNHPLLFAFNVKEFVSSFRVNVGYL